MFPHLIFENIDILAVMTVQKNNFGFHGNRKTQGHKHQLNNLYFKYQVCQMKLRHLNTFLQFRLIFHEPHCMPLPPLPLTICSSNSSCYPTHQNGNGQSLVSTKKPILEYEAFTHSILICELINLR